MITEFGCGAHAGADPTGPAGFLIVQWFRSTPRISPGHTRDEQVQASYLRELLEIYEAEDVHGAFASRSPCPTSRTARTTRRTTSTWPASAW